jgi:hypothetical protein
MACHHERRRSERVFEEVLPIVWPRESGKLDRTEANDLVLVTARVAGVDRIGILSTLHATQYVPRLLTPIER